MTDAPRTVADQVDSLLAREHQIDWRALLGGLGIDPDMPYNQYRRRLEMGERAEKMTRREWTQHERLTDPAAAHRSDGWNACLDHIRGDR